MSLAVIRSLLETQLATVAPAIDTVHENESYEPDPGTPYQAAFLLPAEPDNIEIGPGYTERGLFQASLFFPKDQGPAAATARAIMIRNAFPFRASLSGSGVTVNIVKTPEIGPARAEDDRYFLPVKVRWQARI